MHNSTLWLYVQAQHAPRMCHIHGCGLGSLEEGGCPVLEVQLCRITDQSSIFCLVHELLCVGGPLLSLLTVTASTREATRRWGHWPWRWAWARNHSDRLDASHVANPDRNNSNSEHQNGRLRGEPKGASLGEDAPDLTAVAFLKCLPRRPAQGPCLSVVSPSP